ncbi:MAG TPA: hypothetical protein VFO55_11215 [Gemmatimonadaceae bacterium]|nr:hypothetical protein [Gemmatimonadaceae bacterium]
MNNRIILAALISMVSAARVGAQNPPVPVIPGWEGVAPRTRPDGGALGPVVLTYMATLQQGPETRPLGERSVQLQRSTYAGLSAWEIVEIRGAGLNASVDTLVVDFLSLSPYHWGATQPTPGGGTGPVSARVTVEIRSDTMMGVMSSPAGRRTIVAGMPPGAYYTAAHLETALRALPIGSGWRDSTWIIVSSLGNTAALPASIMVVGQEQLLTPAGTFDCWIVALTTDVGRTQYWVSKPDRIVVQMSQMVPESGALLQYQLSRISH